MKTISLDFDTTGTPALDLETVKSDLRITGNELDAILQCQYIPAAQSWAEAFTKRALISRPHRWTLSSFPTTIDQTLFLPRGRVSAVSKIEYVQNGSTITLTGASSGSPGGTDYQEDLTGGIARIMPNQGDSWPSVDSDAIHPIKVTFSAGWDDDQMIPADLKRALVAHVHQAMELDGLLMVRPGFDIDFAEKQASAYRVLKV